MLYVDNKFGIGQEVYIVQKAREDSLCPFIGKFSKSQI